MGCELGKLAASERGGGRGGDGGGGGGKDDLPAPPATDPRLPLTAKQKYTMVASWKGINREMEATGVNMFIKLFEEHKELLSLFEKFISLQTREQQASSEELQEHATKVMSTLDEGIRGLDDMDSFFSYLGQVGASHRRINGFQSQYFWKIEGPFLKAVEQTLGDRYTANVENIYKVTIKLIIQTLVDGYEGTGHAAGTARS